MGKEHLPSSIGWTSSKLVRALNRTKKQEKLNFLLLPGEGHSCSPALGNHHSAFLILKSSDSE
jgi:hypothetical protein